MPNLPLTENPKSDQSPSVDLAIIAREMRISPENVEATIQLLDAGNTIPFITRFRKDLTGGLNENQILSIKQLIAFHRALAERASFILKSIESQGKLTDELRQEIHLASTNRRLEDLYLPYKPSKRSRAATAFQQGLEPLADDIFSATTGDVDLATRATEFVRVDKGLNSVDEVIRGVGDLLLDRFGENGELRSRLRQIIWNTGKLVSQSLAEPTATTEEKIQPAASSTVDPAKVAVAEAVVPEPVSAADQISHVDTTQPELAAKIESTVTRPSAAGTATPESAASDSQKIQSNVDQSATTETNNSSELELTHSEPTEPVVSTEPIAIDSTASEAMTPTVAKLPAKRKKKKKKKKSSIDPFKDYCDFKQPLKNLLHHHVLAINRGERANQLKVKIQADDQQLSAAAIAALVPPNHPFEAFLKKCAADALSKILFPSLEREIRRELTEAAEKHAVEVFANNLRNLLLQPPIRNRRVLAIDPGFKNGCGIAILDTFGNLIDSGHVFVVGNQSRRDESKQKLVDWVNQQSIDIIAIGTGAACRQAEQLVSDTISEHFQDHTVRYVMVNEAGASIYSTSEIGREELPDVAPSIRSAVSIGRRLQDPLSELVKISPANIGVGMYQHDVKAKHLSESLDDVVEVCVNQVGVNVNTASPSLLKYVSGLNALTARRLVEHRQQINGFKNRSQLKEVSGIGDTTFEQAAGFLRIRGGDNPLDSTSIHPESYSVAEDIIARVKSTPEELFPYNPDPVPLVAAEPAPGPPTENVAQKKDATENVAEESETAAPVEPENVACEKQATSLDGSHTTGVESAAVENPVLEHRKTPNPAPPLRESLSEADAILHAEARKEVMDQITKLEIDQIANDNSAGKLLVRDILMALRKPDWDPRDRVQKPIFRRGIIKVDDLKPEMQLDGQIVNVVDFGVFVDIGLGESSLVHISQLSHQYVRDPHRFCAVGDVLKVWVSGIDTERRRVKLTAIQPGRKSPAQRRDRKRGPQKNAGESTNVTNDQKSAQPVESRIKRFERTRSGQQPARRERDSKPRGRHDDKRHAGRNERPKHHRPTQPAPPITEGMLKGDEPMRTFSDLLQFVQKKPEKPGKDDSKSS